MTQTTLRLGKLAKFAAAALICWLPLQTEIFAADKGIIFAVADDLTVFGTDGTKADADVEIKGYSVFGSTAQGPSVVTSGQGSIYASGALEISSNVYVSGNVGIGTTNPQGRLDIAGQFGSGIYVIPASGVSQTIDWNNGNTQHITLTNNCNLSFVNGLPGRKYILIVKQDVVGGRIIVWPVPVRWPGGAAGILTVTPGKTDYIGFIYNSVDSRYDVTSYRLNY